MISLIVISIGLKSINMLILTNMYTWYLFFNYSLNSIFIIVVCYNYYYIFNGIFGDFQAKELGLLARIDQLDDDI